MEEIEEAFKEIVEIKDKARRVYNGEVGMTFTSHEVSVLCAMYTALLDEVQKKPKTAPVRLP